VKVSTDETKTKAPLRIRFLVFYVCGSSYYIRVG